MCVCVCVYVNAALVHKDDNCTCRERVRVRRTNVSFCLFHCRFMYMSAMKSKYYLSSSVVTHVQSTLVFYHNFLLSVSRWEVPYKDITLPPSASNVPASGTAVLMVQ